MGSMNRGSTFTICVPPFAPELPECQLAAHRLA